MIKKIFAFTILAVSILGILMANPVEAKGFAFGKFWSFNKINLNDWAQRVEKMFENWARLLQISVEKVKNYWSEGKTIKEIMEIENISQEDIQKRMNEMRLEELKSQLQKLVEKGVITQEQANKRLEFMKKQIEKTESKRTWKKFTPRIKWPWLW